MTQLANPITFAEILNPPSKASPSSAQVVHGRWIPPQQQILLYSAEEWEEFIEEWAFFKKTQYAKVVRLTGPGDMGIDVAGFGDASGLVGIWDNYQCKDYGEPITQGVAIPEIGKMLWHSFQGHFKAPRKYYFMAPKGVGIQLKKLLLKPADLKKATEERWTDWCETTITATQSVPLARKFKKYFDLFDFSIFTFKTPLEVVEEHRKTPYFAMRFGGGLAKRPASASPPTEPAAAESRYLQQLFEAYSDSEKKILYTLAALDPLPNLKDHYHRQRESFYHAESLRNFARDTVPPGTFEELQDEVHAGVVEVSVSDHPNALARLTSVIQAAVNLPITANGLISVIKMQDKKGICHQLANEDRLKWLKA